MTNSSWQDYTFTEYRVKDTDKYLPNIDDPSLDENIDAGSSTKKIDDNYQGGYDDILTYFSVGKSQKSLLPKKLVEKFNFHRFFEAAGGSYTDDGVITNGTITLPNDGLKVESGTTRKDLLDQILEIPANISIRTYYEKLDKTIPDSYEFANEDKDLHVGYMIGIAKLVIEYFIYSSILYGFMYENTNSLHLQQNIQQNLIKHIK